MSSVLRSAAESTANVLSDLVDEARDRLEDLPPIARVRRRRQDRRWMVIVAVVGVLLVAMLVRRKARGNAEGTVAQGSFADKKMASTGI